MKKLILGAAVFLFGIASAQIEFENTRFGIIAGPSYSGVKNAHYPSAKRWAFFGGAFAEIPVQIGWSTDQFYIQPEVVYMGAGETGSRDDVKRKYHANYLNVPVFFKSYFSEKESEFFGLIGPRFGFLLNQKIENPKRPIYEVDQAGKANSFDFALAAGLGYSYKRQFELSVRYEMGLSNAYPDLNADYLGTGDPNALKKKSQHIITLGLSYTID